MNNKSKLSLSIFYLSLLTFIAFAAYILYANQEVFYTAHNHSEFLYGSPFFNTMMLKPFGLFRYVGAWLTQLFCKPAIGTGVLAAIWILIFLSGVKAFRLKGGAVALMLLPVACLLTSVVDLGYWVYVVPEKGYWFSQSVGYLCMLLLLWVARQTPRRWHLLWYIAGFCLYPLLGWFSLLFVACLVLVDKTTWRDYLAAVVLILSALLWQRLLYQGVRMDDVLMAGMPRIRNLTDTSENLETPFWVLATVSLLIPLFARHLEKWFVPALSVVASVAFTSTLMYSDQTYIDEMRMVRYAESDNWKAVIDVATKNQKPTDTMVTLKNIALMHDGNLLERSFKINNNIGYPAYNPDSVHVSMLEIASPLVYYNYGMQNEAIRLNYECAVQCGFSPFYLKMLARSTKATGEETLKNRFTALLHHNLFYSDWEPATVSGKVIELQECYPDEISGVENSLNYMINTVSLWYESDSKVASEQALLYSMMRRDSRRFWASLRKYVKLHEGESFPVHAQEAYIMYMDKSPEEKRMMIPVSEEIYARYKKFWIALEELVKSGVKHSDVPDRLRKEFGDTYWYYNIFAQKVYY